MPPKRAGRIDRSTAQTLAAALSVLAVATLVVSSSSSALVRSGTSGAPDTETGRVTLDDGAVRRRVDLRAVAPGRSVSECIQVENTGEVLPVELRLSVGTAGDISEFVDVIVERGSPGGFEDCDSFRPDEIVLQSGLAGLVDGVTVGRFLTEGEPGAFRLTFDLADADAVEAAFGTVDLVWEALPA